MTPHLNPEGGVRLGEGEGGLEEIGVEQRELVSRREEKGTDTLHTHTVSPSLN